MYLRGQNFPQHPFHHQSSFFVINSLILDLLTYKQVYLPAQMIHPEELAILELTQVSPFSQNSRIPPPPIRNVYSTPKVSESLIAGVILLRVLISKILCQDQSQDTQNSGYQDGHEIPLPLKILASIIYYLYFEEFISKNPVFEQSQFKRFITITEYDTSKFLVINKE